MLPNPLAVNEISARCERNEKFFFAYARGHGRGLGPENERTVKEEETRTEIYLTDEEIEAMYDMKLEGMEEKKETGNVVNVPIVDNRVNELCEKYHYDFPALTEQQLNVKIKVVAEKLSKDVPPFLSIFSDNSVHVQNSFSPVGSISP